MDRLIRQYEGWEDADATDILAWMAVETTELVTARRNANELMILLGTVTANQLAAALEAAGLKLVVYSLATPTGINFGDPETQQMLDTLAAQIPAFAEHAATLKAIGKDTRTRWARTYGDDPLPTVEDVAAAVDLAKLNDAKATVRQWRDSVLLPLVDAAINEGKSVAEIKAEIAAE